MSSARKLRIEASDRACFECRKRKTRCIIPAGDERCTYCYKKGRECVFGEAPERTALTRKNLDAAEARCRELEIALQQQQQHVISSPAVISGNLDTFASPAAPARFNRSRRKESGSVQGPVDAPSVRSDEWQEQSVLDDGPSQDGMATLTVPGKDSGYLGEFSIARFLTLS